MQLEMGHIAKYRATNLRAQHVLGTVHGLAQGILPSNEGAYMDRHQHHGRLNIRMNESKIWTKIIQNEDLKSFKFWIQILELFNGLILSSTNEGRDYLNGLIKEKE